MLDAFLMLIELTLSDTSLICLALFTQSLFTSMRHPHPQLLREYIRLPPELSSPSPPASLASSSLKRLPSVPILVNRIASSIFSRAPFPCPSR
jgi:hypothetical protein